MSQLGIVIIGRNEGTRLLRCLDSVVSSGTTIYVDSGSTDGSVAGALAKGASVVELDPSLPFTAARARNAGFGRLLEIAPGTELVQFIDGDCEIASDWLNPAGEVLQFRTDVAVVCGRRRERFPEASRYNQLCDLEWDTPIGETAACGGDALMRVAAVQAVGGYRESLIAGEEPELCARLRAAGWKIIRLPEEMTSHDAAMTRFGQWWRRAIRAGHAYAEVSDLHGRGPDRTWVRETLSIWFWGALVPFGGTMAAVVAAWFWPLSVLFVAVLLIAGYALLASRIHRHARRRGWSADQCRLYCVFTTLSKFPMAIGQAKYGLGKLTGRSQALIEYKSPGSAQ